MAQKLSNLAQDKKIKFGKHQVNTEEPQSIIWQIVAKCHVSEPEYPANSVTLLTEKIIDERALDAAEPSNPDSMRATRGNNNYKASNLSQWLNSSAEAGKWYVPQHQYDAPPDTAEHVLNGETHYEHRAGFLNNFLPKERKLLLPTTIRVTKNISIDGGGYDDITVKVFIPSRTELRFTDQSGIAEGCVWSAFSNSESRSAYLTQQCFDNSFSMSKPISIATAGAYRMRTAGTANSITNAYVQSMDAVTNTQPYDTCGIRPACNLSGDTLISDEPDSDGCYTVILDDPPAINAAPSADLGILTKPLKQIYTITDPDGDILTVTEKINNEVIRTLSDVTTGTKLTFDLSSQWQTLDLDTPYTVEIEVTDGILTATHSWTFSRSNAAPTIASTPSGSLGKLAVPLKQEYTIIDPNDDSMTVTEILDGQIINTLTSQPSGSTLTFDLSEIWSTLSKDNPHSATIEITDGLETATHSWTFNIIEPINQSATVNPSTNRPTSINIPILPIQVYATNNANDADPVWEDASKEYIGRRRYSFKNETKTADDWCVAVKYNVDGVAVPVTVKTSHNYNL